MGGMATIPPLSTTYTLEEAEQDIADLRGQVDAMDEVLQLFDGPVPNTPATSGCVLFSANGQPNFINVTGLQMSLQGAQPAFYPNTTVTASGSITSVASFTIPAGDADANAIYELEVWGNGTQASSRQSLTFTVTLGGTSMSAVDFGTGSFGSAGSIPFRWHAVARVICLTTGASATWTSFIDVVTSYFATPISPGNGNQSTGTSSESSSTTTADSTVSEALGLSVTWGGSGCSVTSQTAVAKRIC